MKVAQRNRSNSRLWLAVAGIVAVVWLALGGVALVLYRHLNHDRPTPTADAFISNAPPTSAGLPVLWDAPAFAFTDQDGRRVSDRDLRGHPYVADFIFTTCQSVCPTMTAKLVLLQRQARQPTVRFVSFSVDPQHDTPAVLKAYAQTWHGDSARWELLSTTPAELAAVVAGMKVTVAPTGDAANPILHSSLFLLVDADGHVRGVYDSNDSDAMAKLVTDLGSLAGASEASAAPELAGSPVERGHRLFAQMGCLACHAQPRVAPPLASVFNGMVRLDDGRTVWADAAYLHESIVDPNAKIVAGYLKTMPSYRSAMTDEQVADVVTYVQSLSANAPGGHGVVPIGVAATMKPPLAVVVDPVCRMHVTADPTGPHTLFNGRTFYFCSDHCREQFAADAKRFADAAKP